MTPAKETKQPVFRVPASKWWQAIGCCFLMSLIGLNVYPMLLVLLMFLIWTWRRDRYYFTVEAMLLIGGMGLVPFTALPVRIADLCLPLCILTLFIYRKSKQIKAVTMAMIAYFAIVILIASTSLESMSVQFYRMRNYFTFIVLFIPLLIFANRKFEWSKFMEAFTVHALVICGFYIVDTFIIGGYILLPDTHAGGVVSTILSPYYSIIGIRHWPQGLYILVPLIPALNYGKLRLSWLHWLLIIGALYASKTNSMLFALIVCWVFFRPQIKKIALYSGIAAVLLVGGYYIDQATGGNLRLAENFDQFSALEAAQDDEDLAEFGSGRMAQILPKWELMTDMHRLHLGLGFLHPKLSTNPKFQIRNDYYTDVSQADEVATEVEVTQVQTILDIGFIGLLAQTLFFFGIYFIIRSAPQAKYYLCTAVGNSVLGIGGFAGFTTIQGLTLLAFILGAVLCANKPLSLQPSKPLTE
ncbi:MAG: hypothetical protein K2N10_02175 [Muribaculaceae bacterium]|nr:hypothetical protein [Muribaculaceae bacterium]